MTKTTTPKNPPPRNIVPVIYEPMWAQFGPALVAAKEEADRAAAATAAVLRPTPASP